MRKALRRVPVARDTQNTMKVHTFPAATRGWVLNENLAMTQAGAARVLDNWFPTTTGMRIRGGRYKWQRISTGKVLSMFNYKSGSTEKLFAADETGVFDITTVSDADTIPAPVIMGQTAGYYSTTQFGTAGGDYLVAVNGADAMWYFDGTDWFPVNAAAIRALAYDGGSAAFARGETVTGGTSGATATVIAVNGDETAGTLYLGPVTGGPFTDDEAITSPGGAAVADGADSEVSAIAITNVGTDDLSQVWSFASRLFFVEAGTMNAWYLPVDSIGGAAASFSLAGIFKRGGSLLFGATWSLDAGDGLDDKCVFVSTEGEVAVYEGTNPGSATTWSKVGVYRIGKPLGINGYMQAGGDLLIATDAGLVPLSQAISKDVAALSMTGVSRPIYPAWNKGVQERQELPWEILKWTTRSMMVISQPRDDNTLDAECFVANMETGAWCRYTNWDTRCVALYANRGFFGSIDGYVYEMERGGSDDGTPYVCTYVGQFDHLKRPGVSKTARQARAIFLAADPFNYRLSASVNYNVELPTAPNSVPDFTSNEWDVALWDQAVWDGSTAFSVTTRWTSVGATGFSHAPQIQITCGVTPYPDVELIAFDMTYSEGGVVV